MRLDFIPTQTTNELCRAHRKQTTGPFMRCSFVCPNMKLSKAKSQARTEQGEASVCIKLQVQAVTDEKIFDLILPGPLHSSLRAIYGEAGKH